ncbi:unnamed protein product [Orchesella dallaii]|uniref:C2H2-type domain-containing protein n=1 Tax=Orchesella dallaii TaxID=48710 RepID=A0ABP1S4T4_9HEXA
MKSKFHNSLCILCYKPAIPKDDQNHNKKTGLEAKFLRLLLRHLNIKIEPKLQKFKNEFLCCEDCDLLGGSFCDLFFQLECLQLQLNWKLRRIYQTMICAGRVPSRVIAFRTQFETSPDEAGDGIDEPSQKILSEIQATRKRLIKNCKLKLKSSKPRVLLQRISNDGDDSTGVEIKSEKLSPKKLNTAPPTSLSVVGIPLQLKKCEILALLLTHIAVIYLSLPVYCMTSQEVYKVHEGCVSILDIEMLMDVECKEKFEDDTANSAEQNHQQLSPCQDNDDGCEYYEDDEGILEEMDAAQETCEDKISSEMDVQNVCEIDTSDVKHHENYKIEKLHSAVVGDGPIVEETLNYPEMRECSSSIHETPLQLSPEIPSIRVEMSTPNAISVDAEESRGRKTLRSLLKCYKCSKTFTNQASMNLHVKLHEENVFHDQSSESDSDSDSIKNEEIVGDTEFMEEDEVDIEENDEHSDVDVVEYSDSETELPPRIKNSGRRGLHSEQRIAKLPFTQCEICLVKYDCEAAVEKCRVVNHKLHKYVCCHSCRNFFTCHRLLARHRKERQRCFPKSPKDLEPAAAPLFPSGREIIGHKFCTVEGCYEVFQYEEWLQVHLKTHGKWDCTLCPAEFGKAHELAVHELDEHKNMPPATEASATNEETMEMTKKMQNMAKKPFSCTRCYKAFDKKGRQISHFVHDHLGIPRCTALETVKVKCEICKKPLDAATSVNVMKRHIQSQHNVEGMDPTAISKCTICQAPFRLRQYLTMHMRLVHKQTPNYKCPHCGKANFRNHNAFLGHLRQVHKGKPSGLVGAFECDICKDRFSNEPRLREHLRSHVDDDKLVFTCETCQKTFSKRVNLNNHVRNVHEQPKKTWHCEKCAKVFKTKAKLDQHTSYTHTDPSQWKFGCPEEGCGKRCWSRQKLTEHIRTHTKERPFICDFCGEAYRFRQYLRTHLAKVHGETAAKTLPTQQYTKPFDQELKEKVVTEAEGS